MLCNVSQESDVVARSDGSCAAGLGTQRAPMWRNRRSFSCCSKKFLFYVPMYRCLCYRVFQEWKTVLRIQIRDLVLFWPLDPGSGIGFFRIPDLGSRIPNPYCFCHLFKKKIIFNLVIYVATKKVGQQICFAPFSFVAVFGSGIRDWQKSGSATLIKKQTNFAFSTCCLSWNRWWGRPLRSSPSRQRIMLQSSGRCCWLHAVKADINFSTFFFGAIFLNYKGVQ